MYVRKELTSAKQKRLPLLPTCHLKKRCRWYPPIAFDLTAIRLVDITRSPLHMAYRPCACKTEVFPAPGAPLLSTPFVGGGPEIVAAHGDLGMINPKTSSIKEMTWKAFFETR